MERPLQDHMAGTYFNVRIGIAAIGAALPVLLWVGGLALGLGLEGSMSAYYHTPLRDVFVGALVAIGVFLYLYKGFGDAENRALNLAGVLAVGVALVPTGVRGDVATAGSTLHAAFAVLFFVAIAYVAVFRATDTLSLIRDTRVAERLRRVYRALGALMVLSPVLAIGVSRVLDRAREASSAVFFIEAAGVWVFAAYWLVKSRELKATDAEHLALEGKLRRSAARPWRERPAPGRVVQVEP